MKLNLSLFGGESTVVFTRTKVESFEGKDLGFNNKELANAKLKFTEIDTQIKTLFQTCKTQLDTAVDQGAFLGTTQVSALKTYIDAMADSMATFLAKFGEFGDKLDTAAANYAAQVESQATTFKEADTEVTGSEQENKS